MRATPNLNFTVVEPTTKSLKSFVTMLRSVYQNLVDVVNGNLGFGDGTNSDNLSGSWINVVAPVAPNTDFTVNHNLNRLPVGYLVMQKDRACNVFTGTVAATKTQLTLQASVASAVLRLFVVCLLLSFFTIQSEAQGVRHVEKALGTVTLAGSSGFAGAVVRPIAGASVTVCTGSTLPAAGSICTGLASIYIDIGLTGLTSNPTTADALGNYSFYAVGGVPYVISVSAVNFTTYSYVWSAPLASGGAGSFTTLAVSGASTLNSLTVGPGAATFTGPFTAAPSKLDNVISCDGITYTGTSALQNAILALPVGGGIVDCSNPLIGNQILTANPFTAALTGPVKLTTGPYTISYDATSFYMDLPHDTTIQGFGTTWLNSTAQSLAAQVFDTSGRSSQQQTGILNNRVYGTTGSITTGTNTLTVASASNLRLRQTIGILGARTLTNQATTTNTGGNFTCTPAGTLTVVATNFGGQNAFGNPALQDAYIQVDNEIMSYTGQTATTFTGLACGLFGTSTVAHTTGAPVNQVYDLVTEITGISGTTITLLDNATFTVSNTFVQAGAMNIVIDGNMVFDANYINRASLPTPGFAFLEGISLMLGANSTIGSGVRVQNSAHGGVMCHTSRRVTIGGHFAHIGRPPNQFGGDVWLFASAVGNTVRTSSHDDGDSTIVIDDRSNIVTRFAGGSNDNKVDLGGVSGDTVPIYTNVIDIEGFSSGNRVTTAHIVGLAGGLGTLTIVPSSQWTTAPVPKSNVILFSQVDNGNISVSVNGQGNILMGGQIPTGSISVSAFDFLMWMDSSSNLPRVLGNFSAAVYRGPGNTSAVMAGLKNTRSGGTAGFPDIWGDDTNALVLGGKSDGSGQVKLGSSTELQSRNGTDFTGDFSCTNVTPVTVTANSTSPQNLMSCSVPAGTLNRVGRTLRVWLSGIYSTPAASTTAVVITVKLGALTLGTWTSTALAGIQATNDQWNVTGWITVQTAGATASFEAHGNMDIDLGIGNTVADSNFADVNTATVGTLDVTATQTLQITFTTTVGQAAGFSASQRQMIAETVN